MPDRDGIKPILIDAKYAAYIIGVLLAATITTILWINSEIAGSVVRHVDHDHAALYKKRYPGDSVVIRIDEVEAKSIARREESRKDLMVAEAKWEGRVDRLNDKIDKLRDEVREISALVKVLKAQLQLAGMIQAPAGG